jgi:predicted acyltransferase (DUF342 family)
MKKTLGLIGSFLLLISCGTSINETVYVDDGETLNNNVRVVNGGIVIGNNAKVNGTCTVINGSVQMGNDSYTQNITTVNGGADIGQNCKVDDEISCVNGSVSIGLKSVIGEINAVNGGIDLIGAVVINDLFIANGDILLTDGAEVKGDIIIKGGDDDGEKRRVDITLKNNSVVQGDISADDPDIEIRIYLSSDSKVHGNIEDSEIVYQ